MESNLYNPAGQPKDWLITNFVARTNVFKKIFKDLLSGKMKYPEQHYLIQGQRGMGKTTLLLRLKYEIENTHELNKWLVPVFFNEESYDLTSLSNLWEKLLKYLDSLWETGGEYYGKTDEFVGKDDYEKNCFELLISILKKEKKKLVIFFDNFGQLFLDNLKEKEQHRFREILMNCNDIRIIGASAVVLQDLHDYSKPFFEFFKIINLEGLDKNETLLLISKLQENSDLKLDIDKNKAKIETLAILTGGVIRTIMLIYEVILADEDGTALRDLETILDRITPLYKHRMEDLPVQQRKIIDVIAKGWDAISTKDIAERIRDDGKPMATKLISAQLQQLEKNNVIEKRQTNTKNHLYQIKERFFNIWYLMRNGDRFDRCRVMWLTKFLESWYTDNGDIEGFIKRHIELLNSGKYYPNSALMIAEALTYSSKVDFENQANLIRATEGILNEEQKKHLPKIGLEKFEKASILIDEKKFDEAIKLLESIDQKSHDANILLVTSYLNINDCEKALNAIKKDSPFKPYLEGITYLQLKERMKALKCFEDALRSELEETEYLKGIIAKNIGDIYEFEKNDFNKAFKYYKIAIEYGNHAVYQEIADLYYQKKNYVGAEKYLLKAIDSGNLELEKNLIDLYIFELKKTKRANELVSVGMKKFPEDGDYIYYKALIFYFDQDYEKSEKLFVKAKKYLTKQGERKSMNYEMLVYLLSLIYVNKKNKRDALGILSELNDQESSMDCLLKSIIYLWDNQFNIAFETTNKYFKQIYQSDPYVPNFNDELFFLLLIAKKQFHFALKLFENEKLNLKEQFKPIYYVLMQSLKDEYPNEYLKMGSELKQPVKDIIQKIEKMAVEYA
jgi:TPR repeat protein